MKNNMKKFLLLFCMLACVFCMTACGTTKKTTALTTSKSLSYDIASLQSGTESILKQLSDASDAELIATIEDASSVTDGDIEFYTNWMNAREELGTYESLKAFDVTSDEDSITMSATVQYSNREAGVEIILDESYAITGSVFNPVYTIGEKMEKAVLNTVMGMGTVFLVLIFISFIISRFKYISVFEQRMKEKKEDNTVEQAVDNTIAQIVQKESDEMDDLELVAVITAAIAASEGTSADGLMVRSIRKVNKSRW